MPSVTRNEGIASRVTKTPLTKPMKSATSMAPRNAGKSGAVSVLNNVHMTTGVKPKTDPTERSNSPEVISNVIARAMSPSSTVNVRALLMLVSDKKAGLIEVKTINIKISRISGPISGVETKIRARLNPSVGATGGSALSLSVIIVPRPT